MRHFGPVERRNHPSGFACVGFLLGAAFATLLGAWTPFRSTTSFRTLACRAVSEVPSAITLPLTKPLTCTGQQADAQADLWQLHRGAVPYWMACGFDAWLRSFARLEPRKVVLIDIGCNKGYESAAYFQLFAPEVEFNSSLILELQIERGNRLYPEGACAALSGRSPPLLGELGHNTSVVVHCIEPSLHHYENLLQLRKRLPLLEMSANAEWRIHHLAVTNFTGDIGFPTGCATELCKLNASELTTVRATSVADFMASQHLDAVDVLKIDTEGFELDVLQGARPIIQKGAATLIFFEYGGQWLPENGGRGRLSDVVADLESHNYACYYDGKPTLTKLSGGCWTDRYEVFDWSNIICAHMQHPMAAELDQISFRHML